MAIRPHHLRLVAVAPVGPGLLGLATHRYLGHRPEARPIPQAQVLDRKLPAELAEAGFTVGAPAHGRSFRREKLPARAAGRHAMFEAQEGSSPRLGFWRKLKRGDDLFVADFTPPKAGACRGEYRFGQQAEDAQCAAIAAWS